MRLISDFFAADVLDRNYFCLRCPPLSRTHLFSGRRHRRSLGNCFSGLKRVLLFKDSGSRPQDLCDRQFNLRRHAARMAKEKISRPWSDAPKRVPPLEKLCCPILWHLFSEPRWSSSQQMSSGCCSPFQRPPVSCDAHLPYVECRLRSKLEERADS